jgi:hypothetical protein
LSLLDSGDFRHEGSARKRDPKEEGMATLREAAKLTEQLEELAGRLHQELTQGDADFTEMVRLADDLGESADSVASTFAAIDEALTERLPGRPSRDESGGERRRQGRRRQESAGSEAPEEETKEELLERAKEAGIEGRSSMSKEELREALEAEASLSKEELLQRARDADIPGRAEMTKEELRETLRAR